MFCSNLSTLLRAVFSAAFFWPYFYSFLSFSCPTSRDVTKYMLINESGWHIRTIALNGLIYGLAANFVMLYFLNNMKGFQFKYNMFIGLITLCIS